MKLPTVPLTLLVLALATAGAAAAELRTWTAADGRKIEGSLRKASPTEIQVVRKDGYAFTIPLENLSKGDQDFIHAHLESLHRDTLLTDGPFSALVTGEWQKAKSANGLPYQVFGSPKLDPLGRYPIVVYLHGSGGRGDDNEKQMEGGARVFAKESNYSERPCFVIAPQCPENDGWGGARGEDVVALIEEVADNLPVDRDRVYITGFSMGGFGTWSLMKSHPDLMAAAVPIAGGGDANAAETMKAIPVWAFHGDEDDQVDVERSRKPVEALRALGAAVKYTEYEGMGHGSAGPAYDTEELHTWMFSQRRGQGEPQ